MSFDALELPEAHALSADEALAALDARREGLDADEAARRLARVGPNRLPKPRRRWPAMLLSQLQDPLVFILLGALALSVGAALLEEDGSLLDAWIILAILVLNTLLGFAQEYRAEVAIAELERMSSPRARVRRGGAVQTLDSGELVPGDVLLLEAGDRVSADARLLSASFLSVEEGALTGESVPVDKDVARVAPEVPLAERACMVMAGTLITRGSGEAVVTATGLRTETGRVAELVSRVENAPPPIRLRMERLGRTLGLLALATCGVVLVLGWARGMPWLEVLMVTASLAVAAVPEGLPAVVTTCFALGVRRMARQRVLVRRLDALETLGGVTVIASDKTGTLTENRMKVVWHWTAPGVDEARLAQALASASHGQLPDQGDPTELALLARAEALGVERLAIEVEEVPFTSERKFMQVRAGGRSLAKGAPEAIGALVGGLGEAEAEVHAAADRALRVLAAADLSEGRLLGLVGLMDPPREGAGEALAEAARAGVRTLVITGDNPRTAAAVGALLGLRSAGALTGPELDALDEAGLDAALDRGVALFARTSPAHKLRVLERLSARGEVVAMTGDGVNDAPALKGAHVGVAMGLRGTEVARESAAIVLADDHYATLVTGIREGRRVHDNIRKFVVFLLRANTAELLIVLSAMALQLPLPYLPIHILWINLLTDGLPALALSAEPAEPDVMQRPPRSKDQGLLQGEVSLLLGTAVVTWGVALAWFYRSLSTFDTLEGARSALLTLTISLEIALAFSSRSRHPIWRTNPLSNRWMLAAAGAVLGLHLLLLYTPLSAAFKLEPVSWTTWLEVWGITAFALGLSEGMKWLKDRPAEAQTV